MTAQPYSPHQPRLRLAVLAALATLLVACGPGVGGSGTGSEAQALQAYGASTTPLCTGSLAANLPCAPAAPPGSAAAPVLSGPVVLADRADNRRVQALLEDQRLRLQAVCPGLGFVGSWADTGRESARFYGVLVTDALAQGAPASGDFASVEAVSAGPDLVLTLRDTSGSVLGGPWRLQRVGMTTGFGSCS
jgi:hypothetical protein